MGTPAEVRTLASLALLYAHVLSLFNPNLTPAEANSLARGAIVQADRQGIDARLLVAVIAVESSWETNAVSGAGAVGLGQLMPATSRALRANARDPQANIAASARYLRELLDRYAALGPRRGYSLALAAYNAGPGAVDRYEGIPPFPETQRYVATVLRLWRRLAGA